MPKILILAANPKHTSRLRLDEELRDIEAGLKRSQQRDQFTLTQRLAVRPRDIQRAMLEETPQIVPFSGHGEEAEGLVFEDDIGQAKLVSGAALAELFELFADPASNPDPVHCVVLNGCYSAVQAEAIAEHVPYVVGMTKAIGDRAAIEFAVGFYDALGAGRPVEFAYKLGCAAISMAGKPESATPVLINKKSPSAAIGASSSLSAPPSPSPPHPGTVKARPLSPG
nr:CHAT domain-containing protein [Nodosilinea sp. LEGE 07088]